MDDQSYETLHRHELDADERCLSLISATLADDTNTYYIAGTAYEVASEPEPTKVRRSTLSLSIEQKAQSQATAWLACTK